MDLRAGHFVGPTGLKLYLLQIETGRTWAIRTMRSSNEDDAEALPWTGARTVSAARVGGGGPQA